MIARRVLVLATLLAAAGAVAQPRPAPQAGPALSASRSVMAGSVLSVSLLRAPAGARVAIARQDDPATSAIVVVEPKAGQASLPVPGVAGAYEVRLAAGRSDAPDILFRQPLATTEPSATLSAPERVRRSASFPVRGIGPNGVQDRVVLVSPDAPPEAMGPVFFPIENVEAVLEVPEQAGAYELRYVMDAPVSGVRVLARKPLAVE
jgi:hypothetical protein